MRLFLFPNYFYHQICFEMCPLCSTVAAHSWSEHRPWQTIIAIQGCKVVRPRTCDMSVGVVCNMNEVVNFGIGWAWVQSRSGSFAAHCVSQTAWNYSNCLFCILQEISSLVLSACKTNPYTYTHTHFLERFICSSLQSKSLIYLGSF